MPGHSRAAKHNWVIPITNGVGCHIAIVARYGSLINKRLLSYIYLLEASEEDKLRVYEILSLNKPTIKRRCLCSYRQADRIRYARS